MIIHPHIAATAALGAYQERVDQAHINHLIDRAVRTQTPATVDATGNDHRTTRSTRSSRSIKRLLAHSRPLNIVGNNHPGTLNPPPITTHPS